MKPKTVEEYIKLESKEAQVKLREMRAILRAAVPKATEGIKWGALVFEESRILFAYAAYKSHIGFMPTPAVIKALKKDLAKYKTGKGSVQFPYDTPLPKSLIIKMAKLRAKELRENDARWM